MHEIVKTAADGHLAVVNRSAQTFGQGHGLLTIAGPDWARKHQILKHMVVDQSQCIGGVDDQCVIALGRIGAGFQQEPVYACGRVVHQRIAADMHHVLSLRLECAERIGVTVRFGAIGGNEGLLRGTGGQHHTEAGILIETILADMCNAVVLERLTNEVRPQAVAQNAGMLGRHAHAAGRLHHSVAASDGGLRMVGHGESTLFRYLVHIQHDVYPHLAQRDHAWLMGTDASPEI